MLRPTFLKNRESLIFELTNRCNLKCSMCDIWKERPKKDFDIELFTSVLKDKSMKNVKNITLTGGEPFMLNNLTGYYSIIKRYFPKAYINISTNGYYKERIVEFLSTADKKRLSITISYDGVYSHDRIRAKKGSQRRLLETASHIRKQYPKIKLSLKLTITENNISELLKTAKLAESLGIPFRIKLEEDLKCHQTKNIHKNSNPLFDTQKMDIISQQAKKILKLNVETNKKYISKLISKKYKDRVTCNWSPKILFFALDGKVFLCRKKDPIGSINTQSINKIVKSQKAEIIKKQMRKCEDIYCLSYNNE